MRAENENERLKVSTSKPSASTHNIHSNHRLIALFQTLMLPRVQAVSMLITALALSAILYKPLTYFNTSDTQPVIKAFSPAMQAVSETAVEVKVGLYIVNFPTFDLTANNFVVDMTLWFEFDPSLLPLETVQKFTFDRGTILSKSEPEMKIINNKLFVQYTVRLQFSTELNHELFPLNDHRLNIVLKNEFVTPQELYFSTYQNAFLVSPNAHTADWKIVGRNVQTGYVQEQLDLTDKQKTRSLPVSLFSLDLAKKGIRKIFIIMLPMIILFFIALFTLSLDPRTLARSILALSAGTLTGLIAYRFVIEKLVPDVGYFTFTDNLFNLFLAMLFIIFLVNIFAANRGENTPTVLAVKGITFVGIQIIFLLSTYALIHRPLSTIQKAFRAQVTLQKKGVQAEEQRQMQEKIADKTAAQKKERAKVSIAPLEKKIEVMSIVIGSTLDLSKTSRALGKRLKQGLELRINQQNTKGGIKGHPLSLVILDDKYTPRIAKKNIISLMDDYKTHTILSPLGTPTTEAFLPLAQEKKILIAFPYTGAMIFRKPMLTNIVHLRASYAQEAQALVEYAVKTLQARKFAVFYQDDSYGQAPLEGARETFKKLNITNWLETSYLRNNPNIDDPAKKIQDYNPDVILFFSTYAPSASLIRKLGINKIAGTIFMGISFLTDVFRNFLRNKGLDIIMAQVIPNPYDSSLEIVREYQEAMKRAHPSMPLSTDSLEGYLNADVFISILLSLPDLDELLKKPDQLNNEIIKAVAKIKHKKYKGLMLNFNPETRELLKDVWIDNGNSTWIPWTKSTEPRV